MRRELYHAMNIGAVLLLALLFCTLQSVVFKIPVISWIEIDLILIVIIYLGLNRQIYEGLAIVVVVSHFVEIHSGGPVLLITSCYLMVFAVTVFMREYFLVESQFSSLIVGVLGGSVWKITLVFLLYFNGSLGNVWKPIIQYLIPYLFALAVVANPVFILLRKIDHITHMKEPSELI